MTIHNLASKGRWNIQPNLNVTQIKPTNKPQLVTIISDLWPISEHWVQLQNNDGASQEVAQLCSQWTPLHYLASDDKDPDKHCYWCTHRQGKLITRWLVWCLDASGNLRYLLLYDGRPTNRLRWMLDRVARPPYNAIRLVMRHLYNFEFANEYLVNVHVPDTVYIPDLVRSCTPSYQDQEQIAQRHTGQQVIDCGDSSLPF